MKKTFFYYIKHIPTNKVFKRRRNFRDRIEYLEKLAYWNRLEQLTSKGIWIYYSKD